MDAIDEALEILGEEIGHSIDYSSRKLGPYDLNRCYFGDSMDLIKELPSNSIHCCVTSIPYFGQRLYMPEGHPDADKEIGQEESPDEYVTRIVEFFNDLKRVLRKDGTFWLNVGDTYFSSIRGSGGTNPKTSPMHGGGRLGESQHFKPRKIHGGSANIKPKDLIGIPWMLAFTLREDGWYLRNEGIWYKEHHMSESVNDRLTKAHEHIFLFTKTGKYYYDKEAVRERSKPWNSGKLNAPKFGDSRPKGGRDYNKKEYDVTKGAQKCDVWKINVEPYPDSHYAVYPKKLPSTCIQLGTSEKGCCPVCGKPWVRVVEKRKVNYGKGSGKGSDADRSMVGGPRSGGREDCSFNETIPVGWQPGCKCEAGDPVPCIVIDPFLGSGTSAEACVDLGRSWLGFDLDRRNERLIRKRTAQMSLMELISSGKADQEDLPL